MTKPAITRPARQLILYIGDRTEFVLVPGRNETYNPVNARPRSQGLFGSANCRAGGPRKRASLSDLEKRMMYFTETGECREDPIALNDAFEAENDTDQYEAKVSKLMHHAYQRIRKENPETARRWKEAMEQLSKGDHYILILAGVNYPRDRAQERPPYDSFKLLGTAILVA